MTLTIVIGSSGSGKTTFLNDVYKRHECIYVRQYHSLRPYIPVSQIPNFDPTQLPYWHIYETEGTAETIPVGGTLAGEFTAGLSGGQRKLLLFELICQRLLPPPQTTISTATNDESQPQSQQQPQQSPPKQTARIPELICLDEPFCGVTDDYVSFVSKRLQQLQQYHFIVLVTNDHVDALTKMAHHIITVSAVDRTVVELQLQPKPQQQPLVSDEKDQDQDKDYNQEDPIQTPCAPPETSTTTTTTTSQMRNPTTLSSSSSSSSSSSKKRRQVVSRELMIQALSVVGKKASRNGGLRRSTRSTMSFHTIDSTATSVDATGTTTTPTLWSDACFFYQVEVLSNRALRGVVLFTMVCLGLFVIAFWNSNDDQAALVLVGGEIIAFFCVNPYLLSLVEWRIAMHEESQALVHSSPAMYRALKTALTITLIFAVSWAEFGVVNAVMTNSSLLSRVSIWIGMFTDSLSMTFVLICLGIYTHLDFQRVEVVGILPFLLMVFFSTTFSPGSGLPGIKELRYLFPRFYFWCLVPIDDMEGCPEESEWILVLYMCLASMVGAVLFGLVQVVRTCRTRTKTAQTVEFRQSLLLQPDFVQLQRSLFGDHMLHHYRRESLDPNDYCDHQEQQDSDETNHAKREKSVEQPTSQTTSSSNNKDDYDVPVDNEECLPEDEV